MAPKEPDWTYLGAINPEELDEDKVDKVSANHYSQ
jgi:hypothetical protein